MAPRVTENYATSILALDSSSITSETPITGGFLQIERVRQIDPKTWAYYNKGIFTNLDVSNIYAIVTFSYVKFDEKNDGVVAEHVSLIVLELYFIFLRKWHPGLPKMVQPQF